MNSFTGIWATFKSLDTLSASIHALKEKKIEPCIVHAPFNISGEQPAGISPTPNLNQFALAGAIIGIFVSIYLIVTMSLEWIQVLSAKPVLSTLTMVPVSFELVIFSTVIFILLGLALTGIIRKNRTSLPENEHYRNYKRFTKDRFGLVVACDVSVIPELKDLFTDLQAEEVFVEK